MPQLSYQKSSRAGRRAAAVAALTLGLVPIAACSSLTDSEATPTSAGATLAGKREVKVHLREWTVEPSTTSVAPGKVTFTARNDGGNTHELVLFKTDLPVERLPKDEDGAIDERGAGVELVAEVEDVKPGAAKSFAVDLAPGSYYLVCNLVDAETGENHFAHNMFVPFKVG